MSDVQTEKPQGGGKRAGGLKVLIAVVIGLGLVAALYVIGASLVKPQPKTSDLDFRKGALAMLEVPGEAKPRNPRFPDLDQGTSPPATPAPDIAFTGPDGKPVKIADFKGKVLVVNFWATWCAPCKEEMPTLGKLKAAYAAQPVEVIAVDTDIAEPNKYPDDTLDAAMVRARAELTKSPPLAFYHTPGLDMGFKFTPIIGGLPTTIIYDKQGVERARIVAPVDWTSPDVRALIESLL